MATQNQVRANQLNSVSSTGPITAEGKSVVSDNALQHGLCSERVLLDDEDPNALAELHADVAAALHPVGSIEHALADRIVTAIWRQRRLERAEVANIALQRRTYEIVHELKRMHNFEDRYEISDDSLKELDAEQLDWCHKVIGEIESLQEISTASILASAPLLSEQVKQDASDDHEAVETYLRDFPGGASGYVNDIYEWCRKQIAAAENRPHFLTLAEQVRTARLVLSPKQLEVFARYQTSLDNQLYKALRAFREAQECRLRTLEASNRGNSRAEPTVQVA